MNRATTPEATARTPRLASSRPESRMRSSVAPPSSEGGVAWVLPRDGLRLALFLLVVFSISRVHQHFGILGAIRPGLTFLGLTGDPDYAELGAMLRQNQAYLFQQPMLVVWPGILLSGLLLVVHLSSVRSRGDGS